MKKTIIIILALVLILVGGIWLYLLLFGAPESAEDLFADLGFGGVTQPVEVEIVPDTPTPEPVTEQQLPEPNSEKLTLLSSKPSVGAIIIGSTTPTQTVRYIEQGIGTLYEVNLASLQETKLSDAIHTGISNAIWSPDGTYVILIKDSAVNREVTLFDLTNNTNLEPLSGVKLPPDADNFAFVSADTFKYTRSDTEGTLGYSYHAPSGATTVLFSVPFTSISMSWGEETIIYNRPSELHPGYAYVLQKGNFIEGVGSEGIGLTAFGSGQNILISKKDENNYYTGFVVSPDRADVKVAIPLLPEKCTVGKDTNEAWCGYPFERFRGDMPNDWYKGKLSTNDDLWLIDLVTGSAQLLEDLQAAAGADIDVVNLKIDSTGNRLLFNDLNTYALWLYDTTK